MLWLIWVTVFVSFFLLSYAVATFWSKRQRAKVRVGNPGGASGSVLLRPAAPPSRLKERLLTGLAYPGQLALPDMAKVSEIRRELLQAGYRHPQGPAIYLGLRMLAALIFTFPVMLYLVVKGPLTPATLLLALCPAVFGFFLVSKILAVKIRHRKERLDKALPDILDLFVISMEAGLSLTATLNRVVEETRGIYEEFSEELQTVVQELRAGIPWEEAFDNLGKRTEVPSIRSMVGLMIQSNKLGASIGDALRHHAEFIRHQRLLIAEEKAAKLPIKMIFPLIFFIMPVMLIVAAGPGILHILDTFFKGGLFQPAGPSPMP